jgi:hypothetical protein
MLKVIVLTTLSIVIENLPAASVSPPLRLFFRVMLTFCKGAWVAESITFPMIIFVCAELNLANETAISNMVMRL